jgi:hypothetical protein
MGPENFPGPALTQLLFDAIMKNLTIHGPHNYKVSHDRSTRIPQALHPGLLPIMLKANTKEENVHYDPAQAARILVRTPDVLRHLLGELGPRWTQSNYGENTFSPYDVWGHLVHGEKTDWIPRARIILEHGERQPFEPFDRFAMYEESKGMEMSDLLDSFELLRSQNVRFLKEMDLSDDDLNKTGMHPELGVVTLGNHLSMWVVHDLGHLAQIARALAFQYKDEIGPWAPGTSIVKSGS